MTALYGTFHDISLHAVTANDKPLLARAGGRIPQTGPDQPSNIAAGKKSGIRKRDFRTDFKVHVSLLACSDILERATILTRINRT